MDTQKVSGVDYVCGWNRYTMDFIGIWPDERRFDRIASYKVLIPKNSFFTQALKLLLSFMEEDLKGGTNEEDTRIMRNIATTSRKISIRSTVMCLSVVIVYVIFRYVTTLYIGPILLFRAYFPYDTRISPNYELTVVAQLIATFYAATSYTAVDTFIAMLVLHTCGQLSNLKRDLMNLRPRTTDEFKTKLIYIVEKHDYLNRFADTIEERFNVMLLIQMIGCTIQLCFQCFQALLSTSILQAVYDCEWYNLTTKEAKSLLMVMHRARTPLCLTAGKFCTFTQELYSSNLLALMANDRKEADTEEEIKRMMTIARISRTISIGSTVITNAVVVLWATSRYLLMRQSGRRALFLLSYFPYESLTTPNFEMTSVGQIVSAFCTATTYTVVDTFVAMLILHACGQFSYLRQKISELGINDDADFRRKLAKIVKKHDTLNKFADTIENKFNGMLLMQMLGCTIELCVLCFQALLSSKMADAAYQCKWYNMSAQEAKCLVLIIRRGRSPLCITAGRFCSFNLQLFTKILKTSMGYLSVLYTMKSKNVE
ncbi:odorant receptor 13a-like [Vespula squamosa]|uniref:Odorant receptor 13a-like n=1 Tax=Vespula squamosa TaxID=30214 RepID=A0ABD2A856_VESSQ